MSTGSEGGYDLNRDAMRRLIKYDKCFLISSQYSESMNDHEKQLHRIEYVLFIYSH